MKTKITKKGDTVVVSIDGMIDYETQEPFKNDLKKLIDSAQTDSTPRKIIFNLENLEFVGSSGISNLVQTLRDFHARSPAKPSYVGVKSEFQKVFRAFGADDMFNFFDDEEDAKSQISQ